MSDYRIDIYNEGNDTSWVFSIYEGTRLAAEGFKFASRDLAKFEANSWVQMQAYTVGAP